MLSFESLENRRLLALLIEKPLDLATPAFGHGAQSRAGAQKIAEDFTLSIPGDANQITFYGSFFGNSGSAGEFDIMFFADQAGAPLAAPFISFNTGSIAGAYVGIDEGRAIYAWTADFPAPLHFSSAGRYWLSVSGSPDWAWENSLSNGDNTVYFRYYYSDSWAAGNSSPGRDAQAFRLETKTPDLAADSLSIDSGAVNYAWSIAGADLSADPDVKLYWSDNDTFEPGADVEAYSLITAGDRTVGTYVGTVSASDLTFAPTATAKYLLLVVDPAGIVDDDPNNDCKAEDATGDADGDELYDTWELLGLDANGDGNKDLDLKALGAKPDHKDLFVEVDAMSWAVPYQTALDRVVAAFANAPRTNPDGVGGISLRGTGAGGKLVVDDRDIDQFVLPAWNRFDSSDWPIDFDIAKNERFGTTADRNSSNFAAILEARRHVFRYAIFAEQLVSSNRRFSGIGEIGGNDFVVAVANWPVTAGTIQDVQAGTFMHELGHTLGLLHGGDQEDFGPDGIPRSQDENDARFNYKPNYHSVMNYSWQFPLGNLPTNGIPGYASSWILDYSHGEFPPLDESNLREQVGLSAGGVPGHESHVAPVGSAHNRFARLVPELGPIDWNRDRDFNDVVPFDVNYVPQFQPMVQTPGDELRDHNDWGNLDFNFRDSNAFADGVHGQSTSINEMSLEVYLALGEAGAIPIQIGAGDAQYPITLVSGGVLRVAVLSSDSIDASTLDTSNLASITLRDIDTQGTFVSPVAASFSDLDADGDLDLILEFAHDAILATRALTIDSTQAELSGLHSAVGTSYYWGSDGVRINLPPSASAAGPTSGVRNQPRSFTFFAADPSPVDQAAGFTYDVDWGDGSTMSIPAAPGNGDGVPLDHAYAVTGSYVVRVTASDKDGGVSALAEHAIEITAVAVQPDPLDPARNLLAVGGTAGDDRIEIERSGRGSRVEVEMKSGKSRLEQVVTDDIGRIVVYGGAGDDHIHVNERIATVAWLFGGAGDDHLKAGGGPSLLLGGAGDDRLHGGRGRGVIIGGLGADHLHGGRSGDILIGGATDHDDNDVALAAIMDEWNSDASYDHRVDHLLGTLAGGLNERGAGYYLSAATVHDDLERDHLEAGDGLDWYFASLEGTKDKRDKVSGLKKRERLTRV